jgi:hypothetical protein
MSKAEFHQILRRVRPKSMTSVTLSDEEKTPGQIGVFLSLIDISRFTRLH